jgi:hypothetical protein
VFGRDKAKLNYESPARHMSRADEGDVKQIIHSQQVSALFGNPKE